MSKFKISRGGDGHTAAEWGWVKFGPQLNYKIAHLQLSISNFVGVIIWTHTHSFIGFDYLGIPGTKNTIAKGPITHVLVLGNLPLLAEYSREVPAQWLIP